MFDSLTLDQIRIFLAVADTGSFSKAAKQLNRAQSAVTYGIQKLEAQFGIPLWPGVHCCRGRAGSPRRQMLFAIPREVLLADWRQS